MQIYRINKLFNWRLTKVSSSAKFDDGSEDDDDEGDDDDDEEDDDCPVRPLEDLSLCALDDDDDEDDEDGFVRSRTCAMKFRYLSLSGIISVMVIRARYAFFAFSLFSSLSFWRNHGYFVPFPLQS